LPGQQSQRKSAQAVVDAIREVRPRSDRNWRRRRLWVLEFERHHGTEQRLKT
jgi:hypothetical protein